VSGILCPVSYSGHFLEYGTGYFLDYFSGSGPVVTGYDPVCKQGFGEICNIIVLQPGSSPYQCQRSSGMKKLERTAG
jgi:hypothetical protein